MVRGHEVSSPLFLGYTQSCSPRKAVYTPKGFFLHAASLPQPFGHWGRFSTAASRRSLGSVSVPVRRVALSRPLSVVGLVGRYPTNYLMDHRPLPKRHTPYGVWLSSRESISGSHPVLANLSIRCSELWGRLPMCYAPVCHLQTLEVGSGKLDC